MEGAIEELFSGRMGYLLAAKSLYVPQSTLESRVIKARANQLTSEKVATNGGMYFPNLKKKRISRAYTVVRKPVPPDSTIILEENLFPETNPVPSENPPQEQVSFKKRSELQ
ncbi:hypothetical protein AVEN_103215-1 [Araneus ventricosus]|uniref:HTH psq-type domain-containing protein n=1 Tax=Araneus ventricosus TaxID=182803 RepID=A0A4Y2F687_ARAVE|nr:hypothetical protein AVEN_103215-1 [Araneus ventricosus]